MDITIRRKHFVRNVHTIGLNRMTDVYRSTLMKECGIVITVAGKVV